MSQAERNDTPIVDCNAIIDCSAIFVLQNRFDKSKPIWEMRSTKILFGTHRARDEL